MRCMTEGQGPCKDGGAGESRRSQAVARPPAAYTPCAACQAPLAGSVRGTAEVPSAGTHRLRKVASARSTHRSAACSQADNKQRKRRQGAGRGWHVVGQTKARLFPASKCSKLIAHERKASQRGQGTPLMDPWRHPAPMRAPAPPAGACCWRQHPQPGACRQHQVFINMNSQSVQDTGARLQQRRCTGWQECGEPGRSFGPCHWAVAVPPSSSPPLQPPPLTPGRSRLHPGSCQQGRQAGHHCCAAGGGAVRGHPAPAAPPPAAAAEARACTAPPSQV